MLSLKEPYPVAQVFRVGISPYTRVQEQISTLSDLSLFCYSYKLSESLYTTASVARDNWGLVCKVLELLFKGISYF